MNIYTGTLEEYRKLPKLDFARREPTENLARWSGTHSDCETMNSRLTERHEADAEMLFIRLYPRPDLTKKQILG